MTTLNSTSILALIIAQNPYHIISIQGQMPMSHAQNTYDFEIAEDDPHYGEISDYSLEDNQDKAYQEIIDQVNAEYGDGGVLQFYSLQGIKEYFEIVHIQTQELTSIGFKTAILDL